MPTSVLVVGCGSIGQRHISNLQALAIEDIVACDPRTDRQEQVTAKYGVTAVGTLEEGLALQPGAALIATPPSFHTGPALQSAERGCHLFIEKPLSDRMEGLDRLISTVAEQRLTTLVGCNMRFHHGPATIKRLLEEGAVGRVITALIDAGQYLPDWHPWEDYRQWYSAHTDLGGGVILDGIHEIDYARWLFGEVEEVYCQGGKLSSLDIDTEDSVNLQMKCNGGFNVSIHMDYIQRAYWRTCKVIGEEGTILWDINCGGVRLFSADENRWQMLSQPEDYTINQMYVDEMQHFLNCLSGDEQPLLAVGEAKRVLEIALAAKDSLQNGEPRRIPA